MLLGRDRERQVLDGVLAAARSGSSAALVLVGEPGIGKTALLEDLAARAGEMRVLRARGIESETHVPFAGLFELVRPVLGLLGRIPGPQAAALEGALALRPASAQDRFAIGAATLSLLAASAEETPLALLVDDAHWLDGSSAEALLFAFRRLVADPIAVVVTVRDDEPSLFDGADLPTLRIEGLDRESAGALLAGRADEEEAVDRLYRATAGNPLALLELGPDAAALAAAPLEAPVPVSTRIANAFLRRAGSLPDQTRRVLLVAAAGDSGELSVLEHAAADLGLAIADLAPAEAGGLVLLREGRVEFRHPLARSAIYSEAPADERRRAHRALADALPDRDADRRAWHLALSATGVDDAASSGLEQAGERARARSAYAVAASAFEQAARLAPLDERRAHLLWAAADAAWLAGAADRSLALLDEARAHPAAPALALQIERLRGRLAVRRGPVMDGHAILVAAAEQAAASDPDLAVVMLAEAAEACFYAGDPTAMLSAAERARDLLRPDSSAVARILASLAYGMALVIAGGGETGAEELRRGIELLDESAELRDDPRLIAWSTFGPLFLREAEVGRALLERAIASARGRAAVGALPAILHHVARDAATTENWPLAHATYHETIRLARETGQRSELAAALAGLAWLEARQGREEDCRAHAAEARTLCAELGVRLYEAWAIFALGELELALGRPAAAIEHLEEVDAHLAGLGVDDVDVSPAVELVEAYLRVGRTEDAAETAAHFEAKAREKGQPWALARAARGRGLVAADGDADRHFDEALELHARTPDAYEEARTRLAYGTRLRRARQRVRAREQLRAGLDVFDRLGAEPWAELARTELAASGETARRRDASTLGELTPQELQIALLLADGKTTRETAAALFLSPKTVEYHLRHVYRKLDVRSRPELAQALERPARD